MKNPQDLSNRGPRKPGRPSSEEVDARPPATPVEPALVRIVDVAQGIKCPKCLQGMVPEVRRTENNIRYLRCSKCGAYLRQDLVKNTIGPV